MNTNTTEYKQLFDRTFSERAMTISPDRVISPPHDHVMWLTQVTAQTTTVSNGLAELTPTNRDSHGCDVCLDIGMLLDLVSCHPAPGLPVAWSPQLWLVPDRVWFESLDKWAVAGLVQRLGDVARHMVGSWDANEPTLVMDVAQAEHAAHVLIEYALGLVTAWILRHERGRIDELNT